jgi:hypothetical protein
MCALTSARICIMPWFVPSLLLTIYSSPLLQLPVPEGSSTGMSSLIVDASQPRSLPHPQHIAFVLQQHSLPPNINVKSFLAGFYGVMEYVMSFAFVSYPTLSLPLPLLDTNQVYIMGTPGLRRVVFGDNISLDRYEGLPWVCHDRERISVVDMGEWTRYKAFFSCELF